MKFEKTGNFFNSNHIGSYLFLFLKSYKKFLNNEIAEYDLNLIQGFCLLLINDCNEINQKDLANGLFLTKGAVTKAFRKLEENGWILRERHPKDKRNFSLRLSKKGEDIIPILHEMNEKWESKMGLEELTPEFKDTFKELTLRSVNVSLENEL